MVWQCVNRGIVLTFIRGVDGLPVWDYPGCAEHTAGTKIRSVGAITAPHSLSWN
jgi:hypothetical protein